MAATLAQARVAKEKLRALVDHSLSLKTALAGIGIGIVGGEYGVKLNLRNKVADQNQLPASLDGVPLEISISGRIQKR